jgi:hypothetical protein
MSIQRWHWGKLVILWAWGIVLAGPMLARFFSHPIAEAPGIAGFTFVASFTILMGLTVITWRWLGGKDRNV